MKSRHGIHDKFRELDTGITNLGELTEEVKFRGGYQGQKRMRVQVQS